MSVCRSCQTLLIGGSEVIEIHLEDQMDLYRRGTNSDVRMASRKTGVGLAGIHLRRDRASGKARFSVLVVVGLPQQSWPYCTVILQPTIGVVSVKILFHAFVPWNS